MASRGIGPAKPRQGVAAWGDGRAPAAVVAGGAGGCPTPPAHGYRPLRGARRRASRVRRRDSYLNRLRC